MIDKVTDPRRAMGINIKGFPKMSSRAVEQDVRRATRMASVLMLQEFRHKSYWRLAARLLREGWGSSPSFRSALLHPTRAAQAVLYKRSVWKPIRHVRVLLHDGVPEMSESRYFNRVLLEERDTGLQCWFWSTHCVVQGDEDNDGRQQENYEHRRDILAQDLAVIDQQLALMWSSGKPAVGEFDGNIHKGTWAYKELMRILNRHNAHLVGPTGGVEYLVVMNGRNGFEVRVKRSWILRTTRLNTDHEGRGMTFELFRRVQNFVAPEWE